MNPASKHGVAGKTCEVCGRRIEWRKKWERSWDEVKFCSAACRRRRRRPIDEALASRITSLLDRRGRSGTVCPSEVARLVAVERDDPERWRELMEPTRAAARRLVSAGEVEVVQRGRVVDPSTARGPIRIRRRAAR
jgi:hypothetical protein